MPRPRYQMTDDDVAVAHRWVRTKFRETGWPREGALRTAWETFPLDHPTVRELQQWCNRFLDAAQWKQLYAVIRTARRDAGQTRTVRLSTSASILLHDLAAREQLTLSETIERYLVVATLPPPQPSLPLPDEPTPVPPLAVRPGAPKQPRPAVATHKHSRAFITTKKGDCSGDSEVGVDRGGCGLLYAWSSPSSQGEQAMFGPGEYVPDPTEGITDVKDLPTPTVVLLS